MDLITWIRILTGVDAHFWQKAQQQKKPNNMKKMRRENNKASPTGRNGRIGGQQAPQEKKEVKRE